MIICDTPSLAYQYHNAGKIEFGNDGMICVTVAGGGKVAGLKARGITESCLSVGCHGLIEARWQHSQ